MRRPGPAHSCRPTRDMVHVQAWRASQSRFLDPRISRPLRAAWRKCTVGARGGRVNPDEATRTGAQVKSNSEQWPDGAGSLPTFGIRAHRCLHIC